MLVCADLRGCGVTGSVAEIAPWMSHFKAGRSFLLAACQHWIGCDLARVAGVAFDELDERSQIDLLARAIDCAERLQNVNALASVTAYLCGTFRLSVQLAQFGCVPRNVERILLLLEQSEHETLIGGLVERAGTTH